MCNCKVLILILNEIVNKFTIQPSIRKSKPVSKCDNFLCTNEGLCNDVEYEDVKLTQAQAESIVMAVTHILLTVGNAQDSLQILLPTIESSGNTWAVCFDRQQVKLLSHDFNRYIEYRYQYVYIRFGIKNVLLGMKHY